MRKLTNYCSKRFKNLFAEYGASVRSERTRDEYVSIVNMITTYLCKDFMKISESDALLYFGYLRGEVLGGRISVSTYNLRASSLKSIAKFLEEKDLDFENPFGRVIRMEGDDSIKERYIPSVTELDQIIDAAKDDSMWYLILCLALRACLSATQITQIRKQNIHVEEDGRVILYFPPGATQPNGLWVTLPEDMRDLFLSYVNSVSGDEAGHIFFNERKNPLSVRNIDHGVKRFVDASGVERKYTIKDLRSRGVLEMASAGIDPEIIQEYTGLSQLRIHYFMEKKHLIDKDCPQDKVSFQLKHLQYRERVS